MPPVLLCVLCTVLLGHGFQHEPAAKELDGHAGQTNAEVLEPCGSVAGPERFEDTAHYLVEQDHSQQVEQRQLAGFVGNPGGGHCQQAGLDQDDGQGGEGGHAKQQAVAQRREQGSQQADLGTELVGGNQREEIDGQPDVSAVGDQVAKLGQQDVAGHEQDGEEVGAIVRQRPVDLSE